MPRRRMSKEELSKMYASGDRPPKGKWRFSANVTMRCNTVCNNCCRGIGAMDWRDYPDMTLEDARRIADTLKRNPYRTASVKLAGGEPLLHKDIYQIAEEFVKIGASVQVITNGLLHKKDRPDLPWGSKYKVDHVSRKEHGHFFASPVDLGLEKYVDPVENCHALRRCLGIEPQGFTPCSVAVTVAKGLGEPVEYSDEPTCKPPMNLCRHCPFALPQRMQRYFNRYDLEEYPTKSFKFAKQPKKILEPADAHIRAMGPDFQRPVYQIGEKPKKTAGAID